MQGDVALGQTTMKKVSARIIPYVFLLYIVAYLDRVNIGYASLTMNKALSISAEAFGLIAGIFFFGYFIFEVPSNIIMHRVGARIWIARILISWGIVVIITAWAQNITQMYILRFILGVAEAGFFPGIILYLTYWFPAKERAKAVAFFMTALAASSIVGSPVSTWILDHVNWGGMEGWRWMFILEGIPAVLLGFVTLGYLTDRPSDAHWLTAQEKSWLNGVLQKEHQEKMRQKQLTTAQVLANGRVWHLAFIYFTLVLGLYGLGFWLPQFLKALKAGFSNSEVGLIAMIPYIAAAIAMVWWARRSDRKGERRVHAAIPPIVGALGLIASVYVTDPISSVISYSVATLGIYSFFGPFWALPAMFLTEASAAVGIALINSVGNLGGFFGPFMIGYLNTMTHNNMAGVFFLSASLIVSSLLILALRKEKDRFAIEEQSNFKG